MRNARPSVLKRMWSVHNIVCQKRTNTDTEGWKWNNNKWNRAIAKAGPGYYKTAADWSPLQQGDTKNVLTQAAVSCAATAINVIDTPRLLRVLVCMDNA